MKKILDLLNVLTISVPSVQTIIANTFYQKYEKIENINKIQKENNIKNNKINVIKIVVNIIKNFYYAIILNNKLYFSSYNENGNVYKHSNYYLNLGEINNNYDKIILNELKYLNPYLNISKLEIIEKTNNFDIIKANNNNKYFVKNIIYYNSFDQKKIINLNEFIKKALLFKFCDENFNLKFKQIDYFDISKLNFENVKATINKNSNLLYNINIKDVRFNKNERINNSSIKKTAKIPECNYDKKSKFIFYIIKEIGKYGQKNIKNCWTLNINDENKLQNFVNINYINKIITHNLSDYFDFSNLNKQEQETILVFNEPEDKIEPYPNEKTIIKYSFIKIKFESKLYLKQKITRTIIVIVINKNSKESETFVISIKEAMKILQKYSLLSEEIVFNEDDDNGINFNLKAISSLKKYNKPKLIIKTEVI